MAHHLKEKTWRCERTSYAGGLGSEFERKTDAYLPTAMIVAFALRHWANRLLVKPKS